MSLKQARALAYLLRLSSDVDVAPQELDRILVAVGAIAGSDGAIAPARMATIADVWSVARHLGVQPGTVALWLGHTLDSYAYDSTVPDASPYGDAFLSRSASRAVFELDGHNLKTKLSYGDKAIAAISSALQMRSADVVAIWTQLLSSSSHVPSASADLRELATIWRTGSIATALGIDVPSLLALSQLLRPTDQSLSFLIGVAVTRSLNGVRDAEAAIHDLEVLDLSSVDALELLNADQPESQASVGFAAAMRDAWSSMAATLPALDAMQAAAAIAVGDAVPAELAGKQTALDTANLALKAKQDAAAAATGDAKAPAELAVSKARADVAVAQKDLRAVRRAGAQTLRAAAEATRALKTVHDFDFSAIIGLDRDKAAAVLGAQCEALFARIDPKLSLKTLAASDKLLIAPAGVSESVGDWLRWALQDVGGDLFDLTFEDLVANVKAGPKAKTQEESRTWTRHVAAAVVRAACGWIARVAPLLDRMGVGGLEAKWLLGDPKQVRNLSALIAPSPDSWSLMQAHVAPSFLVAMMVPAADDATFPLAQRFASMRACARYVLTRKEFGADAGALFERLSVAGSKAWHASPAASAIEVTAPQIKAIAETGGWLLSDVEFLFARYGEGTSTAAAQAQGTDKAAAEAQVRWLRGTDALTWVIASLKQIHTLRTSAPTLWAAAAASNDGAALSPRAAVEQIASGRLDTKTWLARAAKVMDTVRPAYRDALLSWLQFHPKPPEIAETPTSLAALAGTLLTDPKVGVCRKTTRLLFATTAVQTYVDRIERGLESAEMTLDAVEAQQWAWTRRFRVWQANRRVFLYPENFLLPDVRADKTPLFDGIERALAETNITDRALETAMLTYIDGYGVAANVEVVSFTSVERAEVDGSMRVPDLHFLGRSRGGTAAHYYRRFDALSTWTAWEKLEARFGQTLPVIVVVQRRPVIFSLAVEETPKEPSGDDVKQEWGTPDTTFSIQLIWTEQQGAEWSPSRQIPLRLHSSTKSQLGVQLSTRPDRVRLAAAARGTNAVRITIWYDLVAKGHHSPYSGSLEIVDVSLVTGDSQQTLSLGQDITADKAESASESGGGPSLSLRMQPGVQVIDPGKKSDPPLFLGPDTFWFLLNPAHVPTLTGGARFLVEQEALYFEDYAMLAESLSKDASGSKVAQQWQLRGRLPLVFTSDDMQVLLVPRPAALANATPWSNAVGAESQCLAELLSQLSDEALLGTLRQGSGPRDPSMAPPTSSVAQPSKQAEALLMWSPWVGSFRKAMATGGVPALFGAALQEVPAFPLYRTDEAERRRWTNLGPVTSKYDADMLRVESVKKDKSGYEPALLDDYNIDVTQTSDTIQFLPSDSAAIYHWELFYHAPWLVARRLAAAGEFERATRWLRYICDPRKLGSDDPTACWVTRPLREDAGGSSLFASVIGAKPTEAEAKAAAEAADEAWKTQLRAYLQQPFSPNAIAIARPSAYRWAIVFAWLDTLLDWGDSLFRMYTRESLAEAVQIYLQVHDLLGPRPMPRVAKKPKARAYNDVKSSLGIISGLHPVSVDVVSTGNSAGKSAAAGMLLASDYFCRPMNPKLVTYWDRLEDRLFKLHHCLNVEGMPVPLPLYAPPIDPMQLVRAAAAGVDLAGLLSGTAGEVGPLRFRETLSMASAMAGAAAGLGGQMLAALERHDGEKLAQLRATRDGELEGLRVQQRARQVCAAKGSEEEAKLGLASASQRRIHYSALVEDGLNGMESLQILLTGASTLAATASQVAQSLSTAVSPFPDFIAGGAGFASSPVLLSVVGGTKVSGVFVRAASAIGAYSGILSQLAGMAGISAGWQRRSQEWRFQRDQAQMDVDRANKQIQTAGIHVKIAEQEDEIQSRIKANADEVSAYLTDRFTNAQLYGWLSDQLMRTYQNTFDLALKTARAAEASYRYETGDDSASFFDANFWKASRKGLHAAESLSLALRRMESAHREVNKRELVLTKSISLARLFPGALVDLLTTGECAFELTEAHFDVDHPGQYMRRLQSVAVSIPAVTGPYASVNCELMLGTSQIRRTKPVAPGNNAFEGYYDSGLTQRQTGAVPMFIATSTGREDTGAADSPGGDGRYLPFEGAGAVGNWALRMLQEANDFDLASVSDVVLTIRYTARSAGFSKEAARGLAKHARASLGTSTRTLLLSARGDFGADWTAFMAAWEDAPKTPPALTLHLAPLHLAQRLPVLGTKITQVQFVLGLEGKDEIQPGTWAFGWQDGSDTSSSGADVTFSQVEGTPSGASPWTLAGAEPVALPPSGTNKSIPDVPAVLTLAPLDSSKIKPSALTDVVIALTFE